MTQFNLSGRERKLFFNFHRFARLDIEEKTIFSK